jgi:hypothetical protein
MRDQRPGSAIESAGQLADSSGPARTKSKTRISTVEQTEELLRSTILPLAELPEQSLSDTVAAINRLIEEAGVPPNMLQLACDPSNPIAKMKMGRIRMRNVPVAAILQIVIGNQAVRYRVGEGTVEFIPPYMGDVDE